MVNYAKIHTNFVSCTACIVVRNVYSFKLCHYFFLGQIPLHSWKTRKKKSQYRQFLLIDNNRDNCLGPIARAQLGACLSHSEAAACLRSPLIIAHIITVSSLIDQHSNKDTSLTNTHLVACICILRHGGSAKPALPVARRIRPVREKEKRKSQVSICVHS